MELQRQVTGDAINQTEQNGKGHWTEKQSRPRKVKTPKQPASAGEQSTPVIATSVLSAVTPRPGTQSGALNGSLASVQAAAKPVRSGRPEKTGLMPHASFLLSTHRSYLRLRSEASLSIIIMEHFESFFTVTFGQSFLGVLSDGSQKASQEMQIYDRPHHLVHEHCKQRDGNLPSNSVMASRIAADICRGHSNVSPYSVGQASTYPTVLR